MWVSNTAPFPSLSLLVKKNKFCNRSASADSSLSNLSRKRLLSQKFVWCRRIPELHDLYCLVLLHVFCFGSLGLIRYSTSSPSCLNKKLKYSLVRILVALHHKRSSEAGTRQLSPLVGCWDPVWNVESFNET